MNCYNHPNIVAVAQCCSCGKFLCKWCIQKDEPVLCKTCSTKYAANDKRKASMELLVTFGVGFLIYLLFYSGITFDYQKYISSGLFSQRYTSAIFLYISFGIVAGWKSLNKITPKVFMILPFIGWLIYFVVKIYASILVGIVMLPIRTIMNIRILLTKSAV